MPNALRTLALCGLIWLSGAQALPASDLPRQIQSAACRTVPEIDGVVSPEEWRDATSLAFAWTMIEKEKAAAQRSAPLFGNAMNAGGANRKPDSGYRVPGPLIDSRSVASWAAWAGAW